MERVNTAIDNLKATWKEIMEGVNSGRIKCLPNSGCDECFNSGFRQVRDPNGSGYMGVVRCDRCSYWERRREYRENK